MGINKQSIRIDDYVDIINIEIDENNYILMYNYI